MKMTSLILSSAALAMLMTATAAHSEGRRVVVGTTINSAYNPYQESNALNYSIGCQTYGCLGIYDFSVGDFVPMLAKSWKSQDPSTWIVNLRDDVTWDNGEKFTSADVLHSYNRVTTDKNSRQQGNFENIATVQPIDDYTVKITTKTPDATLMATILDRLIVTNKKAYDQYGDEADTEHRLSTGPYKIIDVAPGQYVAMQRQPKSVFAKDGAPDELIIRNMKEPEQRVTALTKGEVQIIQYVPPHLVDTIKKTPGVGVMLVNGIENNLLVMSPTLKPWDNKKLRQAVNYAIDRDSIIEVILGGLADRLDGPIGPGQYAYDPDLKPKYTYDPEKAKQLLKEAGYPNGIDVEMQSSVNRYVNDKQTTEAIVSMLGEVGIRVNLTTPERTKMSADVDNGLVPFFYYGRGSIVDPGQFLSQYFETGVTKRVQYSNPEVDKLIAASRAAFDPEERKKNLHAAMSVITDDAPADFLWRMKTIYGISSKINFVPSGGSGIFGNDITFK